MPPAFGTRAFWEENALRPRDEYKEWFCVYAELAPLLRRCCPTSGTVLHAGRAVTAGVRHLLVCSFSVVERKEREVTAEFVAHRASLRQTHGAAAERLRKRLAKRRAAKAERAGAT